jgi:hypothetical protein
VKSFVDLVDYFWNTYLLCFEKFYKTHSWQVFDPNCFMFVFVLSYCCECVSFVNFCYLLLKIAIKSVNKRKSFFCLNFFLNVHLCCKSQNSFFLFFSSIIFFHISITTMYTISTKQKYKFPCIRYWLKNSMTSIFLLYGWLTDVKTPLNQICTLVTKGPHDLEWALNLKTKAKSKKARSKCFCISNSKSFKWSLIIFGLKNVPFHFPLFLWHCL